jgi:hypothetical protein
VGFAERLRVLALIPALWVSGCAYLSVSGGFGPVLDAETIGRIVPGTTTKGEVLALLGPPAEFLRSEVLGALGDESARVSGSVALGNRAQDAFSYQRDVVWGAGTVLLLYNRVRVNAETDLLVIFFDEEDRVRELSLRRGRRR